LRNTRKKSGSKSSAYVGRINLAIDFVRQNLDQPAEAGGRREGGGIFAVSLPPDLSADGGRIA
jgi:hypothetical protein